MKMKTTTPPTKYPLFLSFLFAVAVLFAGCGDSSVNDDGDPDPEIEESQREAIIAGFLSVEMNFDPQNEEEEVVPKGLSPRWAAALNTTNAQDCPGGGSQTFTQETKNVGSPYANQLEVQRIVSDNCRYNESGSFADGISEFGGAEPVNEYEYRVFYSSASDLSGNPDSGGFMVNQYENPESNNFFRWETRGEMHYCQGCSNPQEGEAGSWEFLVAMEWAWITSEGEYRTWTGQSSSQPAKYILNIDEANDRAEMTWNGRFGSSINTNQCSLEVDAIHTTVSPIVIESFHDGEESIPVSGEMIVADSNGGWSHTVEFRDGDVYVDGVRIDPEEYEDYIKECVFEL